MKKLAQACHGRPEFIGLTTVSWRSGWCLCFEMVVAATFEDFKQQGVFWVTRGVRVEESESMKTSIYAGDIATVTLK
jgi:hypothetical protein